MIRPIHCAILLRNERIVKALIEENLDTKQIKISDYKYEKGFRDELKGVRYLLRNYFWA